MYSNFTNTSYFLDFVPIIFPLAVLSRKLKNYEDFEAGVSLGYSNELQILIYSPPVPCSLGCLQFKVNSTPTVLNDYW